MDCCETNGFTRFPEINREPPLVARRGMLKGAALLAGTAPMLASGTKKASAKGTTSSSPSAATFSAPRPTKSPAPVAISEMKVLMCSWST